MPAAARDDEAPTPRWTYGRCFRWGIVVWLVVWLASVFVSVSLDVDVRGYPQWRFFVGGGSIGAGKSEGPAMVDRIEFDRSFVWKDGTRYQRNWKFGGISAILAGGGWRSSYGWASLWLPTGGLLWLWLAAGWVVVMVRRRKSAMSQPVVSHSIGLAVAAIVLGLALGFLCVRSRQVSDTLWCGMKLQNIHTAMLSWAGMNNVPSGQRLRWEDIIGAGKYISEDYRKCPSGDDYQLSQIVTGNAEAVARCPHPEHQEHFLKHENPGWVEESKAK